jgi:hypothetical protein
LFALVVAAGCASTEVTERQRYQGEKLARPDRIIVHDFTANPAEVPPESAFAAEFAGAGTPTPEQLEVGSKLGAQVAKELVAELQGMGLPAVQAAGQPAPRPDDIVSGAISSRSTRAAPKSACWSGSAAARPS